MLSITTGVDISRQAVITAAKRRGRSDAERAIKRNSFTGARGGRGSGRGRGRSNSNGTTTTAPPRPNFTKGFGGRFSKDDDDDETATMLLSQALAPLKQEQILQNSGRSTPTLTSLLDDFEMTSGSDELDPAVLADLSDAEVAELIGQDTSGSDPLIGTDPELDTTVASILNEFKFPLDAFQVKAIRHVLAGRSVVVCAPTGAGKTAIAEAATSFFVNRKQGKVIYTTPLKALSNQKLGEMRQRFGVDVAGLQTGDASINADGDVVVMTTEILRNMLYRTEDDTGGSAEDRLAGIKLVVFDECHYLGDPGRGSVWEECIINLPKNIQILAMSATVRNPSDLSGWISTVHGPCDTIKTSFRPVPLTWHYCFSPGNEAANLVPLLNNQGRGINVKLVPPSMRWQVLSQDKDDDEDGWGRVDNDRGMRMRMRTLAELIGGNELVESDEWHRLPRWQRIPLISQVVTTLGRKSMLPAIWFIFSRKECDGAVERLHAGGINLTTASERKIIATEIEALEAEQPEAIKKNAVEPLLAGMAAHHAGCLPGWKGLIERLFQQGVVKIVFATETLAAGINMPARTTLLSALSRRRDEGIAPLTHNELLQMAGRAGRRGYDTQGHCVIVQSRWEDADAAYRIIQKGPEVLRSQFSTNYGMALNLLWSRSMEQAREFLDRSFARYLSGAGAQRTQKEIEDLEAKAQTILDEAAAKARKIAGKSDIELILSQDAAEDTWAQYEKMQGRKREEKRALRLLRGQLIDERAQVAEEILSSLSLPRPAGIDRTAANIDESTFTFPALIIDRIQGEGGDASYLCLGVDESLYVVGSRHMYAIYIGDDVSDDLVSIAEQAAAKAASLKRKQWQLGQSGVIMADVPTGLGISTLLPPANSLETIQLSDMAMEGFKSQKDRLAEVSTELQRLRADKHVARASQRYAQAASKAEVLMDRAAGLKEELNGRLEVGWRQFSKIVEVLRQAGAFQTATETTSNPTFTPLGMVAREVRGSNELWLATALTHEALQTLSPPQLAAVASVLVASDAFNRANVYAAYPPTEAVIHVVERLEPSKALLTELQFEYGIDLPVTMDLRLAGVVEAWASGIAWTEVTADCSLDDGDVARLLMRTADLLRQAAYCEHLLPQLRQAARKAVYAMNRTPISDLIE